jgi:phosphoribosyl-ATP pyrophosphohydrolase
MHVGSWLHELSGQGAAQPSQGSCLICNEGGSAMGDVLDELFEVILDRRANPTPGSYTAKLLAGGDEILKKIGEEAMEVLLAGKGQSDQRLVEESADLIYHLLVLLASRDLTLDDVRRELARRRR